jgi:cytoskeleton protein RodZ
MMIPRCGRQATFARSGLPVGEFGDKFRKTREQKKISLDDVSHVTKISTRMLQAIEEEHFDQLPGGVFNKGFIRAYAKHLGLNEEDAVAEYLDCLRQSQGDGQDVWDPQRPAPQEKRSRSAGAKAKSPAEVEELPDLQLPRAEDVRPAKRLYPEKRDSGIPWRIVAVAVVIIILASVLWTRRSHLPAASPSLVKAAPAAPALAPVITAASTPATQPASLRSAGKPLPHPSNPNQTALSTTATTHTPTVASLKLQTSIAGNAVNNAVIPSAGTPNPEAPAKPLPPLALVIRATENSWISIQADGKAVSEETLIAPAHATFRAYHEVVAKVGNAAGVTFVWNGQEIPPQGDEAEVKTLVFDAAGMRAVPVAQPPAHIP